MRIIVFAAALAALFTAALLLPIKGELILGANARVFSLEVGPKLLFGLIRLRIKRKTVLLDDGKLVLLPSGRALKRTQKSKKKRGSVLKRVIRTAKISSVKTALRIGIEGEPHASVILAGALGQALSAASAASGAGSIECRAEPDLIKNAFLLDIKVSFSLVPGKIILEAIKSSRRKR